ncbi:transcriptional regulator SplA domain-containing protein [Bacillus sp. DJP31]|uniref:transcriptional regulator SplA domain-containing protein n=1 Tax=Bacillus sp. DJP31 TaxID=3409789 RepID=UPI003BB7D54A
MNFFALFVLLFEQALLVERTDEMDTIHPKDAKAGDEVYVIYNNPHTASVSNVKKAELVQHPHNPNALALFLHETFHTIEDDDALFASEAAAESAYQDLYENGPTTM